MLFVRLNHIVFWISFYRNIDTLLALHLTHLLAVSSFTSLSLSRSLLELPVLASSVGPSTKYTLFIGSRIAGYTLQILWCIRSRVLLSCEKRRVVNLKCAATLVIPDRYHEILCGVILFFSFFFFFYPFSFLWLLYESNR